VSEVVSFFKEFDVKKQLFLILESFQGTTSIMWRKIKNFGKKKETTICLSMIRQCYSINNTITDTSNVFHKKKYNI